jgi:hypothetical protein
VNEFVPRVSANISSASRQLLLFADLVLTAKKQVAALLAGKLLAGRVLSYADGDGL